jgi:peptidoglycan-associated lipoprotein
MLKGSLAAFAVAAILAGCASTPEEQAPAGVEGRKPGAGAPSATTPQPVKPVDVTKTPAAGSAFAALKDPKSILSKRSVYFDFDKFDVKEEYRPLVEAHAKFLRDNPTARMLIQGNADERGSREYNVGLGQRRSDSVKKMLLLLGAKESQIEAVSLGEEKPQCADHGEECWAKNRRDDMLYNGEY